MMTEMKMSLMEIQEKYTHSEVAIMAWNSQEQVYKMNLRLHPETREVGRSLQRKSIEELLEETSGNESSEYGYKPVVEEKRKVGRGMSKYTDEDGNVDISKLTGPQAWKYMASMGIKLPIIRR